MGKTIKKTHQQFIQEMKEKHPYLTILNEYKNSNTRIRYICKRCGLEWEAKASKLSLGRGCPRCAGNKRKTHEEYVQEVQKINPDIEILSEYFSTSRNVSFRCKKCGYEWTSKPGGILRGKGCYWCGKKSMARKLSSTNDEFLNKLPDDRLYDVLSEYKNRNTKIRCRCKQCKGEWETLPQILIDGHGCPHCKVSHGERAISNILELNNIEYIPQYKFDGLVGIGGNQLSYDFFLPKYNILIEYQGKQHKVPVDLFGGEDNFKKQKEHDKRKRQYAFQYDYKLIEIWFYENIEKKLKEALNLVTVTTAGDK